MSRGEAERVMWETCEQPSGLQLKNAWGPIIQATEGRPCWKRAIPVYLTYVLVYPSI